MHNALLSQEFHSPHTDSAGTHCSAVHIRNRGSLVHGNQTVPSTRKYKIKDPSEDKNGNDFRFWEAQGDTIWWKIVLHRPHSTYVKNVGQIFIFWISLLALTQGFQLPFMCFICTCTSHRLHQAGTIRGETSKPDLIQNSILKVHMLRFLHLKCRKSSLASLSLFETTKILKNWRNKFVPKCPNAVCRIVQFVPPWSL